MDTHQQIIDASLEVFTEYGFTKASTMEIAKRAGVAEVTLFRHFETKQKLFENAIEQALSKTFADTLEIKSEISFDTFLYELIYDRLLIVSRYRDVVRMLIGETLIRRLPKELHFIKRFSNMMIRLIQDFTSKNKIDVDVEMISRILVGILLEYAMMEQSIMFHKLSKLDQSKLVENYVKSIRY